MSAAISMPASVRSVSVIVTAGLGEYKLASKLEGLDKQDVILVRRSPLSHLPRNHRQANPHSSLFRGTGLYQLWRLWSLVRLARKNPDAVLVGIQLVPHGIVTAVVAKLCGRPCVLLPIGKDIHRFASYPILGFPIRWAIRQSSAVGVLGQESVQILSRIGIPPDRCVEIQNVHDTRRFRPVNGNTAHWDLVFVGQLIRRKRVDHILCAFAQAGLGDNASLAVVGDGPELSHLETLARQLGIAGQVDFLGQQSQVEEIYKSSRALVLASSTEGLPAVAIEAMLCGLPVILTRVGDYSQIFRNGENALLVPPDDVEELARAMREMAFEDSYCKLKEGTERVRQQYLQQCSAAAQEAAWGRLLTLAREQSSS